MALQALGTQLRLFAQTDDPYPLLGTIAIARFVWHIMPSKGRLLCLQSVCKRCLQIFQDHRLRLEQELAILHSIEKGKTSSHLTLLDGWHDVGLTAAQADKINKIFISIVRSPLLPWSPSTVEEMRTSAAIVYAGRLLKRPLPAALTSIAQGAALGKQERKCLATFAARIVHLADHPTHKRLHASDLHALLSWAIGNVQGLARIYWALDKELEELGSAFCTMPDPSYEPPRASCELGSGKRGKHLAFRLDHDRVLVSGAHSPMQILIEAERIQREPPSIELAAMIKISLNGSLERQWVESFASYTWDDGQKSARIKALETLLKSWCKHHGMPENLQVSDLFFTYQQRIRAIKYLPWGPLDPLLLGYLLYKAHLGEKTPYQQSVKETGLYKQEENVRYLNALTCLAVGKQEESLMTHMQRLQLMLEPIIQSFPSPLTARLAVIRIAKKMQLLGAIPGGFLFTQADRSAVLGEQ